MRRSRFLAFVSISVLVGCVLAAAILGVAELAVRVWSDVNFNGTSADLFLPNRFGSSTGNTPNASTISFAAHVFTDADGFRVPSRTYRYPEESEGAILILGDSAPFGVGVEEPDTYVGLLRRRYPKLRVYNSSVIGYALPDYVHVVTAMLNRTRLSKVLLFYCLNDISTASATEIEKAAQSRSASASPVSPPVAAAPPASASPGNQTTAPDRVDARTRVQQRLRKVGVLTALNNFLRDKSKLYLLVKGKLTDPSRGWFLTDYQSYLDHEWVTRQLEPLATIAAMLNKHEIEFVVVLAPYEYQVRQSRRASDPTDRFRPQHEVGEYLRRRGIPFVDASPELLAAAIREPQHYFLSFDPMHLSRRGHAEMFKILDAHGLAAIKKLSAQ